MERRLKLTQPKILPKGVNEEAFKEEDIKDCLERLFALLDMLLGYGVDPSDLDASTQ